MKIREFLFLQRQAPLSAGPEAFDLAMTAAAFDQEVRLLLLDDAAHWLTLGLPDLVRDSIDHIGVERESLQERGLSHLTLPDFCHLHARADIAAMIAAADIVVTG